MNAPRGSGLLLDRPWELEGGRGPEAARRARRLGLRWILMPLALGDRQLAPPFARQRLTAVIDGLRDSGIAVWGLGGLLVSEGSRDESLASIDLALLLAGELGLDGWVFETGGPSAQRALSARAQALSNRRPELGRGMMMPLEAPQLRSRIEGDCATFLRLRGPGGLGLARALLAPDRSCIPILGAARSGTLDRRDPAAAAARARNFLRTAVDLDFGAAGLEASEDRLATMGAALAWPPADPDIAGPRHRAGAEVGLRAGDQPSR